MASDRGYKAPHKPRCGAPCLCSARNEAGTNRGKTRKPTLDQSARTYSEQNGLLSSQPVDTSIGLILHRQGLRKEPRFIVKAKFKFACLLDVILSKGQKQHCMFENVLRKKKNLWIPKVIFS